MEGHRAFLGQDGFLVVRDPMNVGLKACLFGGCLGLCEGLVNLSASDHMPEIIVDLPVCTLFQPSASVVSELSPGTLG